MKYHGFISPAPPKGAPKNIKRYMARTYAGLRKDKFPGESTENKTRAAKLTWYQTKRKFPGFFSHKKARAHSSNPKYPRSVIQEKKEHPWLSWKEAEQIDKDHKQSDVIQTPGFKVRHVKPAQTARARKKQVRDIRAAAREQLSWARESDRESKSESKRAGQYSRKGQPVHASVLKEDARVAKTFAKDRKEIARDLNLQAARIAMIEQR